MSSPTEARPYIGGQAVLEGVMMRAPKSFAIVVRRRDGSLHVRERAMTTVRSGLGKLPFFRGIASLVESLKLGSEAIRFSADQMEKDLALADEEEARAKRSAASKVEKAGSSVLSALGYTTFLLLTSEPSPDATPDEEPSGPQKVAIEPAAAKRGGGAGKATMWLMLLMVVAFFIFLPQAAAAGLNKVLGLGLEVQSPLFQLITGALKLTIVIGYMLLIRRLGDIRRVFQYHGAEHKTISTYEAEEPLTVESARKKTTLHPRCGTTFLVMVALVSVLVFTAVGSFLPRIQTGSTLLDNVVFFLEKLPFLPVIAGLTFEIQRLFARYCTTGPLRALLWPGFLVQKITTIEPDDRQLEVALASLKATLFRQDAGQEGEAERQEDVRFASYEVLLASQRLRPARAKAA